MGIYKEYSPGYTINVRDFDLALGDGSHDDTQAFLNSIAALSSGGVLYVPGGNYKITSQLSIPVNVTLQGDGRWKSQILKRFNGAALSLANEAALERIGIDGGHTQGFTGRGVLVPSGLYQYIDRCQITNCESYAVEYSADAGGSGGIFHSIIGGRDDPYVAIKLPTDTQAVPRTFSNCHGGGAVLIDFDGCNDTFVDNCFSNRFKWSNSGSPPVTSTNVLINNCRIAGGSTTISGGQTHIVNSPFASAITFDSLSSNCVVRNCIVPSFAITDNGTGNSFWVAALGYNPTWDQAAGTQPALGNGTLEGLYTRDGKFVNVTLVWIAGSTTTFGNNANAYRFSVPYKMAAGLTSATKATGVAFITDASGPATTTYIAEIGQGESVITISNMAGGAVRSDSPIVFASGDQIRITISYIAG